MSNIKNIIFDLGNVIIDLDIPATENALKTTLGPNFKSSFAKNEQHGFLEQYELGLISETQFVEAFQSLSEQAIPGQEIIRIWNALLVGIPAQRLTMLLRLRENYRIFLLSNTNYTHLTWVYNYLDKTYGVKDFEEKFFEKAFYSHLMHLRKPNHDIYEAVLDQGKMEAGETLFIDDNHSNIVGASECGIQAYHHQQGDISEVIDQLLT